MTGPATPGPQAPHFFKALFPSLLPEERIEIRSISPVDITPQGAPRVRKMFLPTVEEAWDWAQAMQRNAEVYFGVAPRRGHDGTNNGVTRFLSLWADLDFKEGHTDEARRQQLRDLPSPPSIVVATGGGLHAYWLLTEPLLDKERASAFMRALSAHLAADNVGDPARILRVPGTFNHKYDPPRQVVIVGYSPRARYSIEQLEAMLPPALPAPTPTEPASAPIPVQANGSLNSTQVLQGVVEGQRDITLFRFACKLRRANIPMDFAARLILQAARSCTPPFPDKLALEKVARAYKRYPAGPEEQEVLLEETRPLRPGDLREETADQLFGNGNGVEEEPTSLPLLSQSGYIIEGWSHILAGYPRAGKTELLFRLCVEWLDLGKRIVYFTEEPRSIWLHRLRRMSRTAHDWTRFRLIYALGLPPPDIFKKAFSGPEQIVIIDTMRNLLQLSDETDNTRLAHELNPWIAAARMHDKTLLLSHHMRKGAGEHGEGIAGGHALMGMFDVALELLRDDRDPNRRRIRAYARLISPPDLIYELDADGSMRFLGEPGDLRIMEVMARIREALTDEWLTTREVRDAIGQPAPSNEQMRRALERLADQGEVERDPPISTGAAQGRRIRWRAELQGQGQREEGPPAA